MPAGSLAEEGGGVVSGDHSGDHRGPFFLFVRSRRARDLSPHTDDTLPLARFAGAASFSLRDHADTRPPPALHAARTVQRQVTGAGMWRRTGETPGRGQHPAPTPLTASHTQPLPPRALPDVATLQDAVVGSAVALLAGTAVAASVRGDDTPCTLCAGTGGCGCFACATAATDTASDALDRATAAAATGRRPKRDVLGRTASTGACRVCGGTGLLLCRKCGGKGYC